MNQIELTEDYPANVARQLREGSIDVALLPVAVMPTIPGARIVSDYGIAADGDVASVSIFSHVPMQEIETVYLDYQSRTSVRLAQLLHYIDYINGRAAGVIIGDRALKQIPNFEYIYDLAAGWKAFTGLPFVFAAWIANKELPQSFIQAFNEANAEGLKYIDQVVIENPFPYYDLKKYYTENIHYLLDEEKKKGLNLFLQMIGE